MLASTCTNISTKVVLILFNMSYINFEHTQKRLGNGCQLVEKDTLVFEEYHAIDGKKMPQNYIHSKSSFEYSNFHQEHDMIYFSKWIMIFASKTSIIFIINHLI